MKNDITTTTSILDSGNNILQSTEEDKQSYSVPLIKCPSCFGDCYMTNMSFICSDCASVFKVPATAITNANDVIHIHPGQIYSDIIFEEQMTDLLDANKDDSDIKHAALYIRGPILEQLRKIQKKYKIDSMRETVMMLFSTMMEITQMLEQTKSKYIGFVNENGVKSNNLKDGAILNRARRIITESKQTNANVSNFIDEMQKQFQLNAIKKFYNDIDPNHTDNWDFNDKNNKENNSD